MAEGKEDILSVPNEYNFIPISGDPSPLHLKSVEQLTDDIEVAQDYFGKKYVVRGMKGFECEDLTDASLLPFFTGEIDLLKQYGIETVDFDVVKLSHPKEHEYNSRIVTDYVEGVPLEEAPFDKRTEVLEGLLNYYRRKVTSEEDFLIDLVKTGQYRYGSVDGGEVKTYHIDIDFDQNSFFHTDFRERRGSVILGQISNLIFDFSNNFSEKQQVAKLLEDFLSDIDPKHFYREEVETQKEDYNHLIRYLKSLQTDEAKENEGNL